MTAIAVNEQFIGAGQIYIDDVLFANTRENNVWRVIQEMGAPRLNSVRGKLRGTDYILSEMAELEITPVELSAQRLPLMIPGAKVTAEQGDGLTASGADSTVATTAIDPGDSIFEIASATGLAAGNVIQVGPSGSTREFRRATLVDTVDITVDYPFSFAHAIGEQVLEVLSTTLALDSAAGDTNVKATSVSGLTAGDFTRIGYPSEVEVRKILTVGTGGAGGTGLDLEYALVRSHRVGDDVVEITNEGGSLIEASESRRLLVADYHKFELVVPGGGNRSVRFGIRQGIHVGNTEFTAQDSEVPMGPRLTIQSRINENDIEESQWYIRRTAA
jgi:hypothetical protein